MTPERLRELEWAATYVRAHGKPPRCRCAGSCERCRAYREQSEKLTPEAVLELVAAVNAPAGAERLPALARVIRGREVAKRLRGNQAPALSPDEARDLLGLLDWHVALEVALRKQTDAERELRRKREKELREGFAKLIAACDGSEDAYTWAAAVDRARAVLEATR